MAWRSNPLVYQGFYTQNAPLDWDGHVKWFRSRNQDWRTFIIHYDDERYHFWRPIGVVTIGQLDHWSPEIGFYIGEVSLWGKGIGREAVQLALEWLKDYGKKYCHTTILNTNGRSGQLLQSLGFKDKMVDARDGERWLFKEL